MLIYAMLLVAMIFASIVSERWVVVLTGPAAAVQQGSSADVFITSFDMFPK